MDANRTPDAEKVRVWAEELIRDAVEWHYGDYLDDSMLRESARKYVKAMESLILGQITEKVDGR